ncbi:IS21 family transposase [Corynebacterium sp. Z-1]|uniref:IS21 family transposase n=1 Tax=Corynebacterium sp. Z-1 TaxID=3074378 RepID=UPI0028830BC0|nr:IS21 family transposase [Corynebacterium sp. Z-1]WNI13207.1 IS21 family transposase [Corynebacterium sp. Z-1]WNI13295.1 IS21 family transposase [Corynebacterium sp. Z-1]WNI13600.1 IS21 family transposase [Corynebacterium sp. Z-1]WNI13897.1 IS21 family transposase [Corynebacterium sp. Z-1]
MTDYRLVMSLLIQNLSYRQIEALAGCSHTTIAKAKRICRDQGFTSTSQVEDLTAEELDALFTDGRKAPSDEFVAFDVAAMVTKRSGKKKLPLRVLWAGYLDTDGVPGQRHYSYQRFCQIIGEYVDVNDLTMRITHVPGHTMQVDWAGTKMAVFDPITGRKTKVSVFVASLPYSGMVFARGYLDEKSPNWLDAHQQAFEFFGGIPQVVIPDNASTASNQIARGDRARDVNRAYRDFLEHHRTAAVPTRPVKPQDKGNVEAGVKVVTNWVIGRLAGQRFASLDDLNTAVADQVTAINTRTPFRGQQISRKDLFDEYERPELLGLPESRWQPVTWRKSKVNRDYHIEIATVKYSVPHTFAGRHVDVKSTGDRLTVMCDGDIIATHTVSPRQHVYVTDPDHVPDQHQQSSDLWSRAYFLRQAHKVGPHTVAAITSVLDARPIEAQGYRTCLNILALGKGDNKALLEQACRQLVDADSPRAVSYTAVKQRLAALRAQVHARPTTTDAPPPPAPRIDPAPGSRDTRGAHLAGPEHFSLDALLGKTDPAHDEGGQA